MTKQPRTPKGVPTGGQYSATAHDETGAVLTADSEPFHGPEALVTSAGFLDVVEKTQVYFPEADHVTFRSSDGRFVIGEVLDVTGRVIASDGTTMAMTDWERRQFNELKVDTQVPRTVLDDSGLSAQLHGGTVRVALPVGAADLDYVRDRDWDSLSDDADGWKAAGFSAREAHQWQIAQRIGVEQAQKWRDAGFAPVVAGAWTRERFDVRGAEFWSAAGCDPVEAADWERRCNLNPDDVVAFKRAGITDPVQAAGWDSAGWTPRGAAPWVAVGYTPMEAFAEKDLYGRQSPADLRGPLNEKAVDQ